MYKPPPAAEPLAVPSFPGLPLEAEDVPLEPEEPELPDGACAPLPPSEKPPGPGVPPKPPEPAKPREPEEPPEPTGPPAAKFSATVLLTRVSDPPSTNK